MREVSTFALAFRKGVLVETGTAKFEQPGIEKVRR